MLPVFIAPDDILQWRTQLNQRQDYTQVIAYWPDLINAMYGEMFAPAGPQLATAKVHRLPHPYNTKAEAQVAAAAKFDEINRDDTILSMTLIGRPDITAERKIILAGLRSDVDGGYIVKSAMHTFSDGGYQTHLQAYVQK